MNKSVFLTCGIITTIALTVVLPGLSHAYAVAMRGPIINAGRGSVDVNVHGLSIHASHCGVSVGGGISLGGNDLTGRCAIPAQTSPR